jgi:hypothetical protein
MRRFSPPESTIPVMFKITAFTGECQLGTCTFDNNYKRFEASCSQARSCAGVAPSAAVHECGLEEELKLEFYVDIA